MPAYAGMTKWVTFLELNKRHGKLEQDCIHIGHISRPPLCTSCETLAQALFLLISWAFNLQQSASGCTKNQQQMRVSL
jgi:hypothetical protein